MLIIIGVRRVSPLTDSRSQITRHIRDVIKSYETTCKQLNKVVAVIAGNCYFPLVSGVTFMVDSKGRKTAAVIDLRTHRKLWEDFYDVALVRSRAREPRESLAAVKRRLGMAERNA